MRAEIKNRKDQKIVVLVEGETNIAGVGFVVHGLGGSKDEKHISLAAEVLNQNGYVSVRYDSTNTFGESNGQYEDATLTNYYEDMEDVFAWAKGQPWYKEPFILIGHSLGGICVALYAEKHPEKVKALSPMSTVVSGKLSLESPQYKDNDTVAKWKELGWRETKSWSDPTRTKRLKWSHMEDRLKYDLLPEVNHLTMPVLMVVGERDIATPPEHQQLLYDIIPGKKEFHIIPGAPHTF